MSKKASGSAAGNSEAIRIYEKMEEERKRKLAAKAAASKPKKVTLPRLKFMEREQLPTQRLEGREAERGPTR